ncbi:unnamed protein product [Mytilus coruscus]|uniref:Reverse transcriptase domain-containing protein n=1 Tax=Mytilus coruscus TaxID=42192 RepID=A0A6J8DX12_MYTCO|nr:unnamed protein product [Mytilus coruscus]
MKSRVGMKIGNIYTGTPTCADDIALLSDDVEDLQIMLNTVLRNAKQDRVTIHPTKTNAVILNKGKTCRIATGTYLLQTNIAKFSNKKETATCPLCGLEEEDMIHMPTSCILLHDVRKTHLLRLKDIIIGYIGLRQWNETFVNKQSVTQLIVDPRFYSQTLKSLSNLAHITKATSEMCYEIHHKRLKLKLELNITKEFPTNKQQSFLDFRDNTFKQTV